MSENTMNMNLNIEGYKLWMPNQWKRHDQARTIMYTKEELNVNQVKLDSNYDDLPIVILDIGQQGAKKTRVCGFYREYKGSISGLDSIDAQIEMVEIDIRQTKDGKFILMHDITLERTTNGSGNVSDFTLSELQKLKLILMCFCLGLEYVSLQAGGCS